MPQYETTVTYAPTAQETHDSVFGMTDEQEARLEAIRTKAKERHARVGKLTTVQQVTEYGEYLGKLANLLTPFPPRHKPV